VVGDVSGVLETKRDFGADICSNTLRLVQLLEAVDACLVPEALFINACGEQKTSQLVASTKMEVK
jgi:hypothetical protein